MKIKFSELFLLSFKDPQSRTTLLDYAKSINATSSEVKIQWLSTTNVFNKKICFSAVWHALQRFSAKKNISKEFGIEVLLVLSNSHQIHDSLELFGLSNENIFEAILLSWSINESLIMKIAENVTHELKILPQSEWKIPKLRNLGSISKNIFKGKIPSNEMSENDIMQQIAVFSLQ